jgi:peptidoglycan/xylan/chitin deacetylase (PgdA/CDA1 family)
MEFTYNAYKTLLDLLKQKGYKDALYHNYHSFERIVILRHDVDNSLPKAIEFAKIENEHNIKSTYFVLLSTDFYNIFSKQSDLLLKEISALGHDIGLHFDEKRYPINCEKDLERYVDYEKKILEEVLGKTVRAVSMHRPSPWILENNIQFKELINTYSDEFLQRFKYLSDSRMYWREDVIGIINSAKFDKLHILTHPFWYAQETGEIKSRVKRFINGANKERYLQLKDNIRNLEDILEIEEVL